MDFSNQDDEGSPKRAKRSRLSLACNQCRKRKVKCDAEMPRCKNCRVRGHECITTDPRNPELTVYRKPPSKTPQQQVTNSPSQSVSLSAASPLDELRRVSSAGAGRPSIAPYVSDQIQRHSPHPNAQASAPYQDPEEANRFQDEHQGPLAINRVGTRHRRKFVGRSSLQSLSMVLDMCLDKVKLPCIAPAFRHGMRYVEEFAIPLQVELPDLPPPALMDSLLTRFHERIRPIFPVVDVWHVKEKIQYFDDVRQKHQRTSTEPFRLRQKLPPMEVPFLAYTYAILSLAADEASGGISKLGTTFLSAAYGLYAHLVSMPYVPSVQALLLMAIALRGRSKEGQAALLLGQAIRIAQSIGLHRNTSGTGTDTPEKRDDTPPGDDLHARIWWVAFGLEKIFELETTRPTSAHLIDCDQVLPTLETCSFPFYVHFVSLAVVMGQLADTLYRAKRGRGSSAIFLGSMLKLDEALSQWCASVPEHIRPGHLFCDDVEVHMAMFLSHQYHQALITLHRPAIVVPQHEYTIEVEKLSVQSHNGTAAWQRLKKGADLCVQSAKAIIKVDVEIADTNNYSALFTVTPSLLASVVLALQVMRQPRSRMVRSDLEMLSNETLFAEERYRAAGQDEEFIKLCFTLRQSMADFVGFSRTVQQDSQMQNPNASKELLTPSSNFSMANAQGGQEVDLGFLDPFSSVGLEDFWATMDPFATYPDLLLEDFNL